MDFSNSVKQAIEIVKLNGNAAVNVSKDKNATLMGILIIAIGVTLGQIMNFKITTIITLIIFAIIFYFIAIGILHVIALLFGGKAKYIELFRAQSHAAILSWLGILMLIPVLGGIVTFFASLWGVVVNVVILENVHKLSRGKAVIVILLPVIVLLVAIGGLAYLGVLSPNVSLPITP